jgi:hypothetical protein
MGAKKPQPVPANEVFTGRPTSPGPPRRKLFPPITLVGIEALAVGDIVDQLENTIRVLLGRLGDMPPTAVTRQDIEAAIKEAEDIFDAIEGNVARSK